MAHLVEAVTNSVATVAVAGDALLIAMGRVAREVDLLADGNAAIILEAGFECRKPSARHDGPVGPLTGFVAEATSIPGEALCKWDPTLFADKYALEYSTDNGQTWHNGTYASGRRIRMSVPPRTHLLLRCCALGTRGRKSPWCDPVSLFTT